MYRNRYREIRKTAHISPEVASVELGVAVSTLLSWERGETSPKGDQVRKMVGLYKRSSDELLDLVAN